MKYKPIEREDLFPNIALMLLESPFDGVIVTVDEVSFKEEQDQCRMHFNYNIIEDNEQEYSKEDLEQEIGDIIIMAIDEGVKKNSLIYSGGTDGEDREDNIIKSDSQRGILP